MRQRIIQFLGAKTPFSDNTREAAAKLTMLLLWCVAIVPHLFFLFYFWANNVMPMVWINLGSLAFYCVILVTLIKDRLVAMALLITLEATAFCLCVVYYMGTATQVQWYLLLLPIPIYFYIHCKNRYRAIVSLIVLFGMIACVLLDYYHEAPYAQAAASPFLYYLNSIMVTFAFLLEVLLEKIVRHSLLILLSRDVERLRMQSFRDPLTDLYNRRYSDFLFHELARKSTKEKLDECYCVAMIDIDNFSEINDKHGHEAGDKVLKRMSSLLRENVRTEDSVFRWGGEEFLILYKDVDLEQATQFAAELSEKIALEKMRYHAQIVFPTVTIGLSQVHQCQFEKAIRSADMNLYTGKKNGKNCVISFAR